MDDEELERIERGDKESVWLPVLGVLFVLAIAVLAMAIVSSR